jgi:hypothetical protein
VEVALALAINRRPAKMYLKVLREVAAIVKRDKLALRTLNVILDKTWEKTEHDPGLQAMKTAVASLAKDFAEIGVEVCVQDETVAPEELLEFDLRTLKLG